MVTESTLWKIAKSDPQWRLIINTLYLPFAAALKTGLINRDSPLTPWILGTLRGSKTVDDLHRYLTSLLTSFETAEARDASIILSTFGDRKWLDLLTQMDSKENVVNSLIALFTYAVLCA